VTYGARFLKRVIDDRVKIPLSQLWSSAESFRVVVAGDRIVVEPATMEHGVGC
jgi:hypothetical protein